MTFALVVFDIHEQTDRHTDTMITILGTSRGK